ncbi:uncharacterized protein EAF01_011087 [Botrytis porri]|uniref:Uncharacterized protein n=1 Tax=Botrytis porri TaxID=87229 RepID=A0A4Z1KHS5_9HELO|nr:uncharacterized protein EAF01_011087 [Botrytis porri]KAF7887933.1 hypothetical protein EAF01_011087 [Botrytis porri]TGO85653.1 hypothetical protein BPOR_0375g00020 [Botrytis porri]
MDFNQGEITVSLRAAHLWLNHMENSKDSDEFRDKFLNTPREGHSVRDFNLVAEGSALRREQNSSLLVESLNNRRFQGNELRRKISHSDSIDSIRLPGNGTRSNSDDNPSEGQRLLADYNMDIARVYLVTMQRLLYSGSDLDLLVEIDHYLANTNGLSFLGS